MNPIRIAVIPGDGVGKEVVPEAIRVVEAALANQAEIAWTHFPWGADYYFEHGRMMPENAIDTLRGFDAIFLGAIGHPQVADHITLNGLLLPIRRAFDQYANVRPAVLYEGVKSPLSNPGPIDMIVVRENTEGEYAQVGGFVHSGFPAEVAVQAGVFTRHGIERIIRFAFDLARKRNGKKRLTSVTKSNAQGYGLVLWDRVFETVAADYPDISTEELLVDAAAMNFVRRPSSFDVVVASNLFGDILSDISAIVAGSIGLAASANLDPERRFPSMFEPVHGSAPDIAGKGIVNPMAQILSAAMMLDHLGHPAAAARIDTAIRTVLAEAKTRTPDLGGASRTTEVTEAVLKAL